MHLQAPRSTWLRKREPAGLVGGEVAVGAERRPRTNESGCEAGGEGGCSCNGARGAL